MGAPRPEVSEYGVGVPFSVLTVPYTTFLHVQTMGRKGYGTR
jgi:hypothetical protein